MYKPTTFTEMWDRMPEAERRRVDELTEKLEAEIKFWDSLPEPERNKRLEKPKIAYDSANDTLWLKNGRPMSRRSGFANNRVTVFFEMEIWYPSAVKISGASEFLRPIFSSDDAPMPLESPVVWRKENGAVERVINLGELEIRYIKLSDHLWIGNGKQPIEGSEIAEDLLVSYGEDDITPVGIMLMPAARLLIPALPSEWVSAASGLV